MYLHNVVKFDKKNDLIVMNVIHNIQIIIYSYKDWTCVFSKYQEYYDFVLQNVIK